MALIKRILILLLITGLIIGSILHFAQKDAKYIDVRVNLTQLEDTTVPRIDNLTATLVPIQKVSEPTGDTEYFAPGIIVLPIQNAEVIGYWASVPYHGTGTYNLKVGLKKYPKIGDEVLLNIRLVDINGTELQSLTYNQALK